jgi:hypothetical protein
LIAGANYTGEKDNCDCANSRLQAMRLEFATVSEQRKTPAIALDSGGVSAKHLALEAAQATLEA